MSETNSIPVIYGLEFQSRCLVGLHSDKEEIRFAAGTQSIRSKNQIHLLKYSDETREIKSQIFSHDAGEIWGFSAVAAKSNALIVTYASFSDNFNQCRMRVHMLNLPEDENGDSLEVLTELPTTDVGDVKQILSCPDENNSDLIGLVDNYLVVFGFRNSNFEVVNKCKLEGRGYHKFMVGSWSPHHSSKHITTTSDNNIFCWDIRSMELSFTIENAHSQIIRDIDHNPNRQYYIVSGGDDCKIKIWDLRNCKGEPVKEIDCHTHWVWKTRYNPFHDQLILSGGSDSMVALHLAQNVSSDYQNKAVHDDVDDDESSKEILTDGLIQTYEEHEDSVYALDWSPVDPWIFASLSYDGRIVINQVPRRVKYNILL